jgi:hypothetical protein
MACLRGSAAFSVAALFSGPEVAPDPIGGRNNRAVQDSPCAPQRPRPQCWSSSWRCPERLPSGSGKVSYWPAFPLRREVGGIDGFGPPVSGILSVPRRAQQIGEPATLKAFWEASPAQADAREPLLSHRLAPCEKRAQGGGEKGLRRDAPTGAGTASNLVPLSRTAFRDHGGHPAGPTPKLSATWPEHCPPCHRNGVRHRSGILSVMGPNAQPC